jgi:hypothetical protein
VAASRKLPGLEESSVDRWLAEPLPRHVLASLVAAAEHGLLPHGDGTHPVRLLIDLRALRYLTPDGKGLGA